MAEPLACIPGALPDGVRAAHQALTRRLFTDVVEETVERSDGYALRFPASALADVERFVWAERKCCPALSFEIRLGAAGALWLTITGPEGTRELLEAELPLGTAVR